MKKVKVLGCPCVAIDESLVEDLILGDMQKKGYFVAINAEKILKYESDSKLREIVDKSIVPYPDGAGAVLGLKWLHGLHSEKINMPIRALEVASQHQLQTFIVGAKPSVHDIAVSRIVEEYPGIDIVGTMHGYNERDKVIGAIIDTQPQLVLVAMGSPLQEQFASELVNQVSSNVVVIGCGGALDILAGKLKRAPDFWIHNNLEWLYRLIQEPWRISRQKFLPLFLFKLISAVVFKILGRGLADKS